MVGATDAAAVSFVPSINRIMTKCVYLVLLVALSQICDTYRILTIFPIPRKSHDILGKGVVKHLLKAGHEVTHITPFPSNNTNSNYHEVDLSDILEKETENNYTLQKLLDNEVANDFAHAMPRIMELATLSMESENLQKFLSDPTQKFDVIVVEWIFSDFYSGYAMVFNCPFIWLSAMEPQALNLRLIHEPSNPAFSSGTFTAAVPPFSFVERAISLFSHFVINTVKFLYFDPAEKSIYEEFFGPIVAKRGRALPPYEDAIFNSSFMLTNSHASFSQPANLPLNIREIGGYHVDSTKPLPAALQRLMDEAEHGVIYFSMGSNAKSKNFPEVLKQDFLNVLGGVKQTVIWKFEEDLPNKPKNVHTLQWAPQQSILAHPICRLFITHGGVLSTIEAIHFGVPTIVVPCGADQFLNAARAVKEGYALKVNLSYKIAGELDLAINEMLSNPKYTERVKELSKIYHDRLVPPGKELVHWVEHVVRTGGASHLRSPALMMPWYQMMYLDLVLVVIAVLYVLIKLPSIIKALYNGKAPLSKKKTT